VLAREVAVMRFAAGFLLIAAISRLCSVITNFSSMPARTTPKEGRTIWTPFSIGSAAASLHNPDETAAEIVLPLVLAVILKFLLQPVMRLSSSGSGCGVLLEQSSPCQCWRSPKSSATEFGR
jgi:hypothetical protein